MRSVLVAYTLSGDANLDATVDTIDFNLLAANFSQSGKYWFNGDFNYDGSVNTIDFNLLASNFGQTMPAAFGSEAQARREAGTPGGVLVPEPGTFALLIASIPFLRRVRRADRV